MYFRLLVCILSAITIYLCMVDYISRDLSTNLQDFQTFSQTVPAERYLVPYSIPSSYADGSSTFYNYMFPYFIHVLNVLTLSCLLSKV